MFIVIYEFKINEKEQSGFREAWFETTKGIYQDLGSLGSRLHATKEPNVFVAYAQWPNRESWANPNNQMSSKTREARERLKSFIVESKVVYELEIADDYLRANPRDF